MYKRKTRDVYGIMVWYGEWCEVCAEDTYKDAKKMAQCYIDHEHNPVMIKKYRVPIKE